MYGFNRLDVVVPSSQPLPLYVLLQLTKLQGLPELRLLLVKPSAGIEEACERDFILAALSGIGRVAITCVTSEVVDAWLAAKRRLEAVGLPCVKNLIVIGAALAIAPAGSCCNALPRETGCGQAMA
mgnify:CR=1 FL=1